MQGKPWELGTSWDGRGPAGSHAAGRGVIVSFGSRCERKLHWTWCPKQREEEVMAGAESGAIEL
jgi:cytochrome c oxidase assembly protein Cox11